MSFASMHRAGTGRARRPLRVAPAWVGAARPAAGSVVADHSLPVREAVWIWSVRRYARVALWALPVGAPALRLDTLGVATPPGPLVSTWPPAGSAPSPWSALAGLLAGSRTRRTGARRAAHRAGRLSMLLPLAALPAGTAADGSPLAAAPGPHRRRWSPPRSVGAGWLLLGWAVFRSTWSTRPTACC